MVRFKTRYILFELLSPNGDHVTFQSKQILQELRQTILMYFGEYGSGLCQSMLQLKYYNKDTSLGILKTSRDQIRMVHGGLTLMRSIDSEPVIVRVMHISGTLKKTEIKALNINKSALVSAS